MGWKFAIKFHTDKPIHTDVESFLIDNLDMAAGVLVRSPGASLKNSRWIYIIGGPYESKEQAAADVRKMYVALYCLSLTQSAGIDFGEHQIAFDGGVSVDKFPSAGNHGVSIYDEQHEMGVLFHIEMHGVVAVHADRFSREISRISAKNIDIPDNIRRSIVLINYGLRLPSAGARLIIFMAAIESACGASPASIEMQAAADSLMKHARSLKLEKTLENDVLSRIGQLKKVSHRLRCSRYILSMLGYECAIQFDVLYDVRGNLVHEAQLPDMIGEHANHAMEIALALTRAILDV